MKTDAQTIAAWENTYNGTQISIAKFKGGKLPALMILADRDCHAKVGTLLDDQAAEEFKTYMRRFTEVFTCKDCKHYQAHTGKFAHWRNMPGDGVCKYHNYMRVFAEKDYCSKGERK